MGGGFPRAMAVDTLIRVALGPVLLWQGKAVRKKTPRLPEAAGPRKGIRGKGPVCIRLLILGDSAAAGVGVDHLENSLTGRLLDCFGPEYKISWELMARSGMTTAGMVEELNTGPVKLFDLAVTSLGVNDVKAGVRPEDWLVRQKELIELLREKYGIRLTVVSAVPPMDKFPALPWPLGWYLGRQALKMNDLISGWIPRGQGIQFLSFDLPLDPALMADDGFHPGPAIHTIWANQAAGLMLPHV